MEDIYSNTTSLLQKINLNYLKQNSTLIYFEAIISKGVICLFDNDRDSTIDTYSEGFNFMKTYKNFRKR